MPRRQRAASKGGCSHDWLPHGLARQYRVHNELGILERGNAARQFVLWLHYDVVDAKNSELRAIGGLKWLGHYSLPSRPPLLAEILEVVHLAACLPVYVNGSQRLSTEDARVQLPIGVGEKEHGGLGRRRACPLAQFGQRCAVQRRVINHLAEQRDDKERSYRGDGG